MGKPNAYSLFVDDNFRRMQREGKHVCKPNLFKELGPKWTSLPDAEKQRYKDRAKNPGSAWSKDRPAYGSQSNPASHLLVSEPKPASEQPSSSTYDHYKAPTRAEAKPSSIDIKPIIADIIEGKVSKKRPHSDMDWGVDDDDAIRELNEKKVRLGIPNHWRARTDVRPERYQDIHLVKIRENCKAIVKARANNLIYSPLYTFSCNVLCFKRLEKVETFVPIEIGICTFSIKAGRFCRPYHVIIDAGPPPEGCVNLASDHAEATHKITIPPQSSYPSKARKDYRKIYREIVDYIKAGERTILVWNSREMKQVIGCLEWLYERAVAQPGLGKLPRVSTWTVLPMVEFTATMANYVEQEMLGLGSPVFVVHYYYNMLLDQCMYDYDFNYMCDYHKRVHTKWCALSCATRMYLNLERAFEVIIKGYARATDPAFIERKMKARIEPILYTQHQASAEFLESQARAADEYQQANPVQSGSSQESDHPQQQPSQEPLLALPAPESETLPTQGGDESVRMTIDNEQQPPNTEPATESPSSRLRYVEAVDPRLS